MYKFINAFSVLSFSTLCCLSAIFFMSCGGDSDDDTPLQTANLNAEVEVIIDNVGIPHIYAGNEIDAFWVQGYISAKDRLYQMDTLRRRALGRLAEIFGENYLDEDEQSRAFRFKYWGEQMLERYRVENPFIVDIMTAYCNGVNAYREDVKAGKYGLTFAQQFDALGYSPEQWQPEDCFAIEKMLTLSMSMRAEYDITIGLFRDLLGEQRFRDFFRFAPFDDSYVLAEFFSSHRTTFASTQSYEGNGYLELERMMAAVPDDAKLAALEHFISKLKPPFGSNNWVVAPDLTESGYAMLCNDTHQGVYHPAVYYIVHLNTSREGGSLNSVGANFPGVPLVFFGHNETAAWGATTSQVDPADAYLETVQGDSVLFNGQQVPIEYSDEPIKVRKEGGSINDFNTVLFKAGWVPHHGPIVPTSSIPIPLPMTLTIRWTGFHDMSDAQAFYEFNKMDSFDDFRIALTKMYIGAQHWTYADTAGNIGYSCRDDVPLRDGIDVSAPPTSIMPGTGGHEWQTPDNPDDRPYNYLPDELLPWTFNPAKGYMCSANNDPIAATQDNDPFNDPIYFSGLFDIGTRSIRIEQQIEEITAQRKLTWEDMVAMQGDTTSRVAVRTLPYLIEASQRRPDLVKPQMQEALSYLEPWDYRCGTEQVAPTLFHAWFPYACMEILVDEMGSLLFMDFSAKLGLYFSKFLAHHLDITADIIDELDAGTVPYPSESGVNYFDDKGTDGVVETRDEVLLRALDGCLADLEDQFADLIATPSDMSAWKWGVFHTIKYNDMAEDVLPEASSDRFPQPGGLFTMYVGDFTLMENKKLPPYFDVDNAPSQRFVFEMKPGAIRGVNTLPGGQQEDPGTPHHNDQIQRYLDNDPLPLAFYRDEVEALKEETWIFPKGYPETGQVNRE